eukprot:jgi/Astpho2/1109/e_gw1.00020.5.1_t
MPAAYEPSELDFKLVQPSQTSTDSGEARLAALGYKQELSRGFSLWTNCAISFSIISVLTGITGSYGIAYNNGGPVSVVWGWVAVVFMTMFVALSMAEIVSALPSSGGPYFWASVLGGPTWGPFFAWVTGFFNLLGQVAVTAAIEYTLANHIAAMVLLGTDGARVFTQAELLGVYAAILICHGVLNTFGTAINAMLNAFSSVWHMVGVIVIVIVLPSVAVTHQSGSFVFSNFQGPADNAGAIDNSGYIFLIGMLMSQFTITGYDACAHMSEETKGADRSAPVAIIMAVGASAVFGFAYLLAITFSIQDASTFTTGTANGYLTGQIFFDAFQGRFGHGGGGIVLMGIPAIAMFCCGMSSLTSNSRMLWSFSRDHGMPFSFLWSRVNRYFGIPVNAVWFMGTFAFLLGLPMLKSYVAFSAVVSISTIGLYISYMIPIFLRLTICRLNFVPGPFSLGIFSIPVGITAVLWVLFITAVFVLPTAYPVTSETLNYSGVAVGIVLFGSLAWWFFPIKSGRFAGARYWYTGGPNMSRQCFFKRCCKFYLETIY